MLRSYHFFTIFCCSHDHTRQILSLENLRQGDGRYLLDTHELHKELFHRTSLFRQKPNIRSKNLPWRRHPNPNCAFILKSDPKFTYKKSYQCPDTRTVPSHSTKTLQRLSIRRELPASARVYPSQHNETLGATRVD